MSPKHRVLYQNKYEKWSISLAFIIRVYHVAWSSQTLGVCVMSKDVCILSSGVGVHVHLHPCNPIIPIRCLFSHDLPNAVASHFPEPHIVNGLTLYPCIHVLLVACYY